MIAHPRIEHVKCIANTPALKLAVAGWHELLEADLCGEGGCLVQWDHKAIIAYTPITKEPIGVLTWTDNDWSNAIHTSIAYVVPKWRRTGVHTAMFKALVEKAVELRRPVIQASARLDNLSSRASMRSQERSEIGVVTRYQVPLS